MDERLSQVFQQVQQLAHLRPYLLPAWERLMAEVRKVETDLTALEVVLADLDREARLDFKSGDIVIMAGAEYLVMQNKGGYGICTRLDDKRRPTGRLIENFQWEAGGHRATLLLPGIIK